MENMLLHAYMTDKCPICKFRQHCKNNKLLPILLNIESGKKLGLKGKNNVICLRAISITKVQIEVDK